MSSFIVGRPLAIAPDATAQRVARGWVVVARKWLGAALVSGCVSTGVMAFDATPVDTDIPTIARNELPKQATQTLALIESGGPFPYDKDGTVFGNRERILPKQRRGYYREYTVKTPGLSHRGARRIVCGGLKPTTPDRCYYTQDHYASFKRIVDGS